MTTKQERLDNLIYAAENVVGCRPCTNGPDDTECGTCSICELKKALQEYKDAERADPTKVIRVKLGSLPLGSYRVRVRDMRFLFPENRVEIREDTPNSKWMKVVVESAEGWGYRMSLS